MNLNYVGSLAERFITLRSGVQVSPTTVASSVFNSFVVYVPSLFAGDAIKGITIPEGFNAQSTPIVYDVTVDTYKEILADGLLSQWGKVFLDGANYDTHLYVVIFYVPDGSMSDTYEDYLTVNQLSMDYAPLTKAYELSYNYGYRKTLFFNTYAINNASDAYKADLYLCLSQLCKRNPELSQCLIYLKLNFPLTTPDSNQVLIASTAVEEEVEKAVSFNDTSIELIRVKYFWGFLNLIQASNTWCIAHSESLNMFPVIFAQYFSGKNDSGTYVGNKLAKIRLSGTGIKPTGYPSILNSSINVNIPRAVAELLDSKNVGYFISIADGTENDCILVQAKSITGIPIAAIDISKWVDYYTTQSIAEWITNYNTNTQAVLRNEVTYKRLQDMLLSNLQRFARMGRLTDIYLNMPAFSQLPESKTDIIVTQGWSATYVDDVGKIVITGMVAA